jgi:hypothetical protein
MTALAHIAPTLGKLVRLLGSDQDHETLGAARALKRVLSSAKLDLHDLASLIEITADSPVSTHRPSARSHAVYVMVRSCHERSDLLSAKELAFVRSIAKWHVGELSPRQFWWLHSLYERVERERRQ